ncbi:MAG: phage tail protein, partial [Gemmatimonadetes bacterium]|nr:phage tail protein [Gemmatimonadota bacterium]
MRPLPLLLLSLRIATMANAIELHVSPSGDDDGDGSAEQPFATPARARDALRHLKSAGPLPAAGATVWLHGGAYRLRQSFLLEEQDSGSPGAPITWRAAPGERPRFLGGIELPPAAWDPVEDPAVLRKLPEEARNSVRRIDLGRLGVPAIPPAPDAFKGSALPELFAGGERLPLARWPNEGWATS